MLGSRLGGYAAFSPKVDLPAGLKCGLGMTSEYRVVLVRP